MAKGAGDERWAPRFSYKGFQYVQLSGPEGRAARPRASSVAVERIQQVRTGLAATATFESSSETLNRIHRNTAWAIQSNLHGVITDTPVYEKNAWTGDAQLTAGTASLLFDTERLYRKMFQDMLDAQTEQGEVPLLAPSNQNYGYVGKPAFKPVDCCGATPAWDAFWFVIPWESYTRYGNRAALEATYPAMQKYLDLWIPRWTGKDGDAYAQTLTAGLGDWVPPAGRAHDQRARVDRLLRAPRAHRGGRRARSRQGGGRVTLRPPLREHPGRLQRAVPLGRRRLSREGHRPLRADGADPAAGVRPRARRPARGGRGPARGRHHEGPRRPRLRRASSARATSCPCSPQTGHHDVAYAVATQTTEPSWGYWTDVAGFTALGEHWPATTRSRNHHFFGAIVQWLYEDLAGMRPLAPGYARIEFKPEIPRAGLDRVSASYESVRGTVATSWRRTATGLELDVTVPANATGRVYVPAPRAGGRDRSGRRRRRSRRPKSPSVKLVGVEGDRVVYEVGSGRYQFRVAVSP